MTGYAISVEGLCKEYVIGGREKSGRTFREAIMNAMAVPLHRLSTIGREAPPEERFWALRDVTFNVKPGEVVGIIGRNGAGKSTLLKILSRITNPTKGRIEIRGRVSSLLEVGTGFHPELTGRENIYLNGAILGMSRAEITRKFDEIIAFSEIEKFLDTPIKRYSSGMYVRLAFAVAAHLDPEILIVDEVLAVGDVAFQKKCLGKMGEFAGGGRTVVFVSHNMRAVVQLCKRALLLSFGELKCALSASQTVAEYLSEGVSHTSGYTKLESCPPRNQRGTREAEFVSFELLNSRGETSATLAFGEPAVMKITLRSLKTLNGVFVGFCFISSDGRELQGTSAHDSGSTFQPGIYVLSCLIDPMMLVPGRYFIRAAIFRSETLYHRIDEVMQFEVLPVPHAPHLVPTHFVGDLYFPYRWSVVKKVGACDKD
jgi:lipopolysaccharide transport system ATP-binding protein